MRVSIAIDNTLYYSFELLSDDMIKEIVARVYAIAGKLWDRVEWYTETSAGVISVISGSRQIRRE